MKAEDVIEIVYGLVPERHRHQVLRGLVTYSTISPMLSVDTLLAYLCGTDLFSKPELLLLREKIQEHLGISKKAFQGAALPLIEETSTLVDLRAWVTAVKVSGVSMPCPACDQNVKVYKRDLNGVMAKILCLVHQYFKKHDREEWLHVDNFLKIWGMNVRYYSLLKFWNLLEAKVDVRDDGSDRTGYWRITDRGRNFVEGKIMVPEFFYMYNQEVEKSLGVMGWSEKHIYIQDALAKGKFNYREILDLYPSDQSEPVSVLT